jgi:hypothetical protein
MYAGCVQSGTWQEWSGAGGRIVSMDHHPHATDNAVDQTDQELLIFTVSDEELEKAAGGTTWAQTYPGTGVATICQGTKDETGRIA